MAHNLANIELRNETSRPRVIWIEPWGEELTIMPGETIKITAKHEGELPYFGIVDHDEGMQVFIETSDPRSCEYWLAKGGEQLAAGPGQ